jgi:diazepam-binding inhibitor (GABA receptor modulating acyl-CoA-binding protein)
VDFLEASKRVQDLKKRPDNSTLLKLYSLYKQGSDGDVTGSRPGLLDIKGRAKWDAWQTLKGLSQQQAQRQYVALVTELVGKDK